MENLRMPKLPVRITSTTAAKLPAVTTTTFFWCPASPGFGIRVTATGDKAYISERRVDGKTVRRTLGKAAGAAAISADAARKLQLTVSSELATGIDRAVIKRETARTDKLDATTLSDALERYVQGKRRGKDGLPLKERTKADYLGMIAPGRVAKDGRPFADGPLHCLASKPINKITAEDMRKVYAATPSQRQKVYTMQVLRAVLNWHGVVVPDSPLSKTTPGKDRIVLAPTKANPLPMAPELLGAWWRAASARAGHDGADGLRFMLLTGARPGEIFGSKFEPGLLVQDVDLIGGRMVLPDTKNRLDHAVPLSRQALDIVRTHCQGKASGAKVFNILDPGKALDAINAEAATPGVSPHKLRHTFASVTEELVSGYALKKMLNQSNAGDVTTHYVGKSENQLRAAWQLVADFVTESASVNTIGVRI